MQAIERQRDPLKIGMLILLLVALAFVGFYFYRANQARVLGNELAELEATWEERKPQQEEAIARQQEIERVVAEAEALRAIMEERFSWARLLATITNEVPPNASLTSFGGQISQQGVVTCQLSGLIASDSPRQSADDLRRQFAAALNREYGEPENGVRMRSSVRLPLVENEADVFEVAGRRLPSASFNMDITIEPLKPEGDEEQ